MDKITDAAGLPRFTVHALRHTFATRMLEANISPKIVQDVLGHSDVTLTLNTYSHVIGTTAHEHMAKLDNLFGVEDKTAAKPVKGEQPKNTSKKPTKATGVMKQLELARAEVKERNKTLANKEKSRVQPDL